MSYQAVGAYIGRTAGVKEYICGNSGDFCRQVSSVYENSGYKQYEHYKKTIKKIFSKKGIKDVSNFYLWFNGDTQKAKQCTAHNIVIKLLSFYPKKYTLFSTERKLVLSPRNIRKRYWFNRPKASSLSSSNLI